MPDLKPEKITVSVREPEDRQALVKLRGQLEAERGGFVSYTQVVAVAVRLALLQSKNGKQKLLDL
jgi:hypothetical protein